MNTVLDRRRYLLAIEHHISFIMDSSRELPQNVFLTSSASLTLLYCSALRLPTDASHSWLAATLQSGNCVLLQGRRSLLDHILADIILVFDLRWDLLEELRLENAQELPGGV